MHVQVNATGEIVAYGHFPTDPDDGSLRVVEVDDAQRALFDEPGTKMLADDGTVTVLPLSPDQIAQRDQLKALRG